ncbi:MAG TPA: alpha/beta fold hydrolase [Euryarchaeota archaeon]|nr:alpha/beta fold hydrolase [Euryarchaeota archaeon]
MMSIMTVLVAATLILAAFALQPPKERVVIVNTDGYVFKDPSFSFQFMRTMGCSVYGGADIGECVQTAQRIVERDFESWCREWTATAERVKKMGDEALARGHNISAAESYLRASTYFRAAEFYLHGNPQDPRIPYLWGESRDLFVQSLQLSGVDFERVSIAYEGTTLPGYFYKVDEGGTPRATIIVHTGFDGTQEELYPYALAAMKRGYNVLTFEGPGQGEVLRVQGLHFRADWENVVTPVIDHLEARTDVDKDRIALWGISLGGYLAPRAAAFEHRIAALIADGGVYDIVGGQALQNAPPGSTMEQAKAWFIDGMMAEPDRFNEMFHDMMGKSTDMRWSFEHGMYAFGETTPVDYMLALARMSMEGLAGDIVCPTLVCDAENDTSMPKGQAMALYENLTCPKEYRLFTDEEAAGMHCQIGAYILGNQVKLDWLMTVMAP